MRTFLLISVLLAQSLIVATQSPDDPKPSKPTDVIQSAPAELVTVAVEGDEEEFVECPPLEPRTFEQVIRISPTVQRDLVIEPAGDQQDFLQGPSIEELEALEHPEDKARRLAAPDAELEFTQDEEGSPTFTFDGSKSTAKTGAIAEWKWDFGDGTTGAGRIVEHTYAAAGVYTVYLWVTDDSGRFSGYHDLDTVVVRGDVRVYWQIAPTSASAGEVHTLTARIENMQSQAVRGVNVRLHLPYPLHVQELITTGELSSSYSYSDEFAHANWKSLGAHESVLVTAVVRVDCFAENGVILPITARLQHEGGDPTSNEVGSEIAISNEPPSIAATAGRTIRAEADGLATVPDFTSDVTRVGACSSDLYVQQIPAAGTRVPVGSHEIRLEAGYAYLKTRTWSTLLQVEPTSSP